jgi:hypothetical protein
MAQATQANFINLNGSYNVAAIMAFAHRKARHGFNTGLIVLSGYRVRCTLSEAEAEYARIVAQFVDRHTLTIPACLSYATEFRKALAACWYHARAMRARFVPAAPVVFQIAA